MVFILIKFNVYTFITYSCRFYANIGITAQIKIIVYIPHYRTYRVCDRDFSETRCSMTSSDREY